MMFGGQGLLMATNVVVSYRYWRLQVTANNGGAFTYIPEFKLLVGVTEYPPNMISNTSPSPYVISGNTSSGQPFQSVNGALNNTGVWAAGTCDLIIDMGSAIIPTGYFINSGSWSGANLPNTWTVSGSTTGSFSGEETIKNSQSGQTFPTTNLRKDYTIP